MPGLTKSHRRLCFISQNLHVPSHVSGRGPESKL